MLLRLTVILALACSAMAQSASTPPMQRMRDFKATILSTQVVESGRGHGEWGFSALIEADGRRILFDTGAYADTVLKNAEEMHIDLSTVEEVVLSHHHGDHTGGLLALRRALMKKNPKALSRAYIAPEFFAPRRGGNPDWMSTQELRPQYESLGGSFVVVDAPRQIAPGLWLAGPVPRRNEEHTYPLGVSVERNGQWEVDKVPEDMPLIADTIDGVFLVTGCGHSGLINNLMYAKQITGRAVAGAVGGFHLFAMSDPDLRWTADQLRQLGIHTLAGAHCTGIESVDRLRQLLAAPKDKVYVSGVGSVFRSPTVGARAPDAKF